VTTNVPPMRSDPIFSVSGLGFTYGDIIALDDVTAEVPGGTIGLVGANGAGKTTLLKILLGVLPPAAGSVTVLGRPVAGDLLEVRSRVGWMPESDCLPPDQSAADFIEYAARLGGLPARAARQRASDVLGIVGLHEERFRYMGEFSTGMRQRAKLAQAIVHDPDLVLLDEPTAGLDPDGREEMLGLIARLGGFGIHAVVSSHVLPDIERTCSWVVMLDGGTVRRSGPMTDLSTTDEVALEVFGDASGVAAAILDLGGSIQTVGSTLRVRAEGGADPFTLVRDAAAATGTSIRRMGSQRTTLEDVFLDEHPHG
jgi:ABC-2 type transport system ATP-binding protein